MAEEVEVSELQKEQVTSVSQLTAQNDNLGQVTSVSQFSDVQPTDWAFQALQSLVERYGCIAGYPNGTYRGNRAMTRYEFAAGLNACLDRVNELIATATTDLIRKEDLATLQRLQEEFSAELATLRGRVDALEARTAELEANQFSTTTKLRGEVIFAVADVFNDERALPFNLDRDNLNGVNLSSSTAVANALRAENPSLSAAQAAALVSAYGSGNFAEQTEDIEGNTVFAYRTRLNFDASFSGSDRLRVRLQARNIPSFNNGVTGTNMTRLGFDGNNDGSVEIDELWYQFNLSNALRVKINATNGEFNDDFFTFNPAFESSGSGALSRYGRFSPIYRQGDGGAGISLTFAPQSPFNVSVGYLSIDANNPDFGNGLFKGGYAAFAQVGIRPSEAFNVGLTYVRSYYNGESGVNLSGSTGSFLANRPFGNFATTANHYGAEVLFRPSPKFALSGWAGYTDAKAEAGPFEGDDANIFYWAAALALQDFGREGNTLGFIFGQPPRVTDSDTIEDENTSYHIEALYKLRISDNVAITPGVLVILNPEYNDENDTIYVGTIRTTFTF
ncbi:MAG: iron uptake porin [Scytonema sp. PMC 1069.18]|nr:iron uptake porin [Scytonema sp. PMC 1069.18]MEC4882125.1 iron uptake porin [Scytonema sp. PMC 1070.18]